VEADQDCEAEEEEQQQQQRSRKQRESASVNRSARAPQRVRTGAPLTVESNIEFDRSPESSDQLLQHGGMHLSHRSQELLGSDEKNATRKNAGAGHM
jgi:hypothetical protein